jgi:hypothetical protein
MDGVIAGADVPALLRSTLLGGIAGGTAGAGAGLLVDADQEVCVVFHQPQVSRRWKFKV